jgi:CRISPR-associated protein Cas5d
METVFMSKPFYFQLKGEYALFTDPVSKGGGEKFTYQIPTYQALKGITENIYWKPTLIIYIDEVKVINKIQTETKGIRTMTFSKSGDSQDRSYYTYLKDVEYLVKVHFEWNLKRDNLSYDRNEIKHQEIMVRSLKKGGRRDVFLGTRECLCYVSYITENEYIEAKSYYEAAGNVSYGNMFHSFVYPDEACDEQSYNKLSTNFHSIVMKNGVIPFVKPDECSITNVIRDYDMKEFNQIKSAEEELKTT